MPSEQKTPRVVVVGGGIAGLATAYLLRELGREAGQKADITVLEALAVPGGSTRTDHEAGYTCEWGPNGFLDNEPCTLDLVQRLGLTNRLLPADESAGRRFIYWGGKMREVPVKPPAFLMSDILPASAKLRMAMELMIPAKRDGVDESVYSFGTRRLGKAFADHLLDPMVSGIFAGNARELSLPAVFPKMVDMERDYGGLFKAMFKKAREAKRTGKKSGGPAGASAVLNTFKNGMGELTDTLARELDGFIHLAQPVVDLSLRQSVWHVQGKDLHLEADAVVMACPSYVAADIIERLDPEAARAIRAIPFAPVDVVCHGHAYEDLNHDLKGFGVLVPRAEGVRSLGSLWCDSIFPGQAPVGRHLLRTIIGGAHDPQVVNLSEQDLHEQAARDHHILYGLNRSASFRRVIRHEKGIAQYTLGHLNRVAAGEALEARARGLFFTGASYRGVSINGCAKDAFRVARLFWDQFGARS
jgi:oxygen-dependent protoporphyrinogen oxidase